MNMKRLASVLLVLCSVSAFAKAPPSQAPDPEVWITLGSDALEHVNAAFASAGHAAPSMSGQKADVTALRVRESQLNLISRMMHEKLNRCGGFIYHDTEAAALAALDPSAAAKAAKATAVTYSLDNASTVNALQAGVQELAIRGVIDHLSSYATRYYTSTTGVTSANWLKGYWESLVPATRSDVTVEFFNHASWAQPSVILTITGTTLSEEVVVLGGHLDSTSSGSTAPGADDDASGIATLTEVIRVAMLQNYRPERTVKFMAYAAEEVGLRGSSAIATKYAADDIDVVGVLQLDMTNYQERSDVDVALVSDRTNAAQNTFVTSLIDTYQPELEWTTTMCGYACSDHASWTSAGFAASMPFEGPLNNSNPYIHTVNDTLHNSGGDARHALKFAKLAAAYVAELAKGGVVIDETPPEVAITAPAAGSTVSGVTTVTASATDASGVNRVEFFVDGELKATDTTAPYAFDWDTAAVPNGSHAVTARAVDLVGVAATSSAVTVTVSNATSTAGFDPILRAPRCASVSNACDSGTLLNGRGGFVGPEVNAPNTLKNSCRDGLSGTHLVDQSNERIVVSTVDETAFAPGKLVRVDATVFAYNKINDKLDLFYTTDANNPAWQHIATLPVPSKGLHTLSATYTLPEGTVVHAVRAVFRNRGSTTPCMEGNYNDHDDLIFAVQPSALLR
ncbi:M20/M25/M40 family metallo-hydrolase [Myxococcus sp. AM009]|uniref:M20/M25/M40 family metallo-hydrolase n=1 Tax=Myxococcus sp. AM009 TaxID=2745137 RepID=UPI001595D247|nr:M20/M25/M40 family metallo-hydrolase [Myxococcus sp. AM009]NVI99728.1 M20/M25/M40 family metallo-hydrolase [Myxococcus sp. AM009]